MVKYIISPVITAAVLFGSVFAAAQEIPVIKASVLPGSAAVGEEISYFFAYEKSSSITRVETPEKRKYMDEMAEEGSVQAAVPLFEITDIIKEESADSPEVKYTFRMRYFRTGTFTLPEVLVYDGDNIAAGYKVPQIEIKSTAADDKVLPDEPPLDLGGNYTRLIMLVLGAAAAAAALTLLVLYVLRRRGRAEASEPETPPIEIFRMEIAALRERGLIDSGEHELYCVEISRIFKKFISLSMKIDAVEMTSSELLSALTMNAAAGSNSRTIVARIEEMTNLWDLSKFAEFNPSAEILESNLKLTSELAEKIIWEKGNVRFRV